MNNTESIIFSTLYGSRLYGLNNDESDFDYKYIFKIPKEKIICHPECAYRVYNQKGENDEEYEFMSFHQFIKLALQGQTMAIDMLWAPKEMWEEPNNYIGWENIILPKRTLFLSKNMNAFVGYAASQAYKYSNKGKHIDNLKAADEVFRIIGKGLIKDYMNELTSKFDYKIEPASAQGSVDLICFNGIKIPITITGKVAREIISHKLIKYGNRAKQSLNDGGDMKAISHAFRVIYEMEELITENTLTFPLKEAVFLKEVKYMNVSEKKMENTIRFLEDELHRVKDMLDKSSLPDKPKITADEIISEFYNI